MASSVPSLRLAAAHGSNTVGTGAKNVQTVTQAETRDTRCTRTQIGHFDPNKSNELVLATTRLQNGKENLPLTPR